MAALVARSVGRRISVGSNTGRRVVRVGDWVDPESLDAFESPRAAMVSGFSVHANIAVEARDRMRLERLLRYAARPAVSTDRLSELPDGRLHYRLKRPWRDGTTAVVFERQDFIAKLAALAPGAACPPDAVSRGAGSGGGVEVRDHPSRECSIRGHRNKLEDSHREIRGINLFRCTR
jgi:hypothetical protein